VPTINSSASATVTEGKKNRRGQTPEVFDHVGLLINEPPGMPGLPFI
jgi:hypothetical protein